MTPIIKVLLVDDHILVRKGIAGLLKTQEDIEVVGQASDGAEALAKAGELTPDRVLMDINMPRADGLEATRRIVQEVPGTQVVLLTYSDSDRDLAEGIRRGARGYLLKDLEPEVLFSCLRDVYRGQMPISPALTGKLLELVSSRKAGPSKPSARWEKPRGKGLTPREKEVLRLVSQGTTNQEIARQLSISLNTVKNHLKRIMEKLGASNRAQAVAYALRENLLG